MNKTTRRFPITIRAKVNNAFDKAVAYLKNYEDTFQINIVSAHMCKHDYIILIELTIKDDDFKTIEVNGVDIGCLETEKMYPCLEARLLKRLEQEARILNAEARQEYLNTLSQGKVKEYFAYENN